MATINKGGALTDRIWYYSATTKEFADCLVGSAEDTAYAATPGFSTVTSMDNATVVVRTPTTMP